METAERSSKTIGRKETSNTKTSVRRNDSQSQINANVMTKESPRRMQLEIDDTMITEVRARKKGLAHNMEAITGHVQHPRTDETMSKCRFRLRGHHEAERNAAEDHLRHHLQHQDRLAHTSDDESIKRRVTTKRRPT